MSKFIVSAGGSGGHLFPAQALAHELMRRGHTVQLMTDKRANSFVAEFPAEKTHIIPAATPNLRAPAKAFQAGISILQGIAKAYGILKREDPDAVIGFGGYPTFPPLIAATLRGVPTVLHEQNAVLGRANRATARFADIIALSFDMTKFAEKFEDKCIVTGNPVRDLVVEAAKKPYPALHDDGPINVLVTGGSQGAQVFSDMLPGAMMNIPDQLRSRIHLVQQCRADDLKRATAVYAETRLNVELAPFFKDLPRRIANAHLVICRAGASTIFELAQIGRPAIYVPLPGSLDQDQLHNAQNMVDVGGGVILEQGNLSPHLLATELTKILCDPEKLKTMAQNAKKLSTQDAVAKLALVAQDAANEEE
ncbi:undecaprenyldiphospho-muramoylpentapeptide beta-N-acetylglucosaminyltransferase [uncultured Maritalea sp.]|mgnify:CR=1 FL=1|jgi:UDP-N-acetylglucosamine--N-acetylmuramyl-(pentapeptide) pyrophosphoryl-undecaprenol N-acetylglucosamine transferase|uniref:undecaprenyldiphospho-muramoylpentapeptide beta-N-acetylglucosaminyltransferase n=1 Tax=uncultured Maritalea sp. TaxID=757249 RepID=UPI002608C6DC|nr:undecaprenyldiphospho-muramoylpentapeptide beta-N-acetylglucosaminyltransferase [uncultured Maritalea sp.]